MNASLLTSMVTLVESKLGKPFSFETTATARKQQQRPAGVSGKRSVNAACFVVLSVRNGSVDKNSKS